MENQNLANNIYYNEEIAALAVSDPVKRTLQYHAAGDINDPVLSASTMSLLLPAYGGSFDKFRSYLEGRYEKKNTKSLSFGSLVHLWHENPASFVTLQTDKPSGKLGIVCDVLEDHCGIKPYYQDSEIDEACAVADYGLSWKDKTRQDKVKEECEIYWKEKAAAEQAIGITKADRAKLDEIRTSIQKDAGVEFMLQQGESEYPIFCEFEGLKFKGLLDRRLETHRFMDLKTSSDPAGDYMGFTRWVPNKEGEPTRRGFSGAFQRYYTYRQMAWYMMLLSYIQGAKFGTIDPTTTCHILVVETTPPYEIRQYNLNAGSPWIQVGRQECLHAVEYFKMFLASRWQQ